MDRAGYRKTKWRIQHVFIRLHWNIRTLLGFYMVIPRPRLNTECQSQTEFLMRVWKPRKLFEIGFNLCNVMKKYCIIHSLDGGGGGVLMSIDPG